jgi:hypothetical protein
MTDLQILASTHWLIAVGFGVMILGLGWLLWLLWRLPKKPPD